MSVFPFNSEMSSACLTPEEEEFEAKSLEDQAYGLNKPVHGKDTGLPIGRIKLCDLKLRTINNTPVILGEGGFGKVYLGEYLGTECALKVVLHSTRDRQAMFLTEIRLLEQLQTEFITRYLGFAVARASLVMLIEYLPGGTLWKALAVDDSEYQWYKRGKEVVTSVAKALIYLHAKKTAHKDVKSPNILLDKHREAKLSDFGLSKMTEISCTMSSSPGSLFWASPEQLIGGANMASDIYSLGVVLWEVCTCERPTMQKVLGHQRKIDVPEEAPQEVVDLIEHCHEVDYESRISAEEFLIKLQECSHTRARQTGNVRLRYVYDLWSPEYTA